MYFLTWWKKKKAITGLQIIWNVQKILSLQQYIITCDKHFSKWQYPGLTSSSLVTAQRSVRSPIEEKATTYILFLKLILVAWRLLLQLLCMMHIISFAVSWFLPSAFFSDTIPYVLVMANCIQKMQENILYYFGNIGYGNNLIGTPAITLITNEIYHKSNTRKHWCWKSIPTNHKYYNFCISSCSLNIVQLCL